MNFDSTYLRLPAAFQNLVCSIKGALIKRSRYARPFWDKLREYEERGHWSQAALESWRDRRLALFLQHCYDTVPYYRQAWDEFGFDPGSVVGLNDLMHLPIIDKAIVRENFSALLSRTIPARKRIMAHTSGSVGSGLRFAITQEFEQEQWAVWWRYRRWHGIQSDTWCAHFGGRSLVPVAATRPPFWRLNYPGKQVMFSAYHLTPSNFRYYVDELNRRKLPWIHAYPSVISILASFMIENDVRLDYRVQWITTGAENLLEHQRKSIFAAFGVEPIQHYGMSEGVANISERPDGRLYVDEDFSAVEFIPRDSGGYSIVGTNVANLAMPMVRYEVGDIAELPDSARGDDPATVGHVRYGGRQVVSIDGRLEDYVVLSNGAQLGRLDHIFKDLEEIQEAQIYQPARGEIVVRVVKGREYTAETEASLLREFRQRVGAFANIGVEYREELPRTKSGKLRFVESDIAKQHHP